MATFVTDLIDRVLVELGDTQGKRTTRENLLTYFNEVQDDIATQLQCLEYDSYFDLEAGYPNYEYPADGIQIKGIRVSKVPVPASAEDYRWLRPAFREEWRENSDGFRLNGSVFTYHARNGWFELMGTPDTDITDGGIVTCWTLPAWIDSESDAVIELPDFLRTPIRRGMEILARKGSRELAFASAEYKEFRETIANLRDPIETKADDRRASIRPPLGRLRTAGMR